HRAPPAGCALRGVFAERYAVFERFFYDVHPMLAEQEDLWPTEYAYVDADGFRHAAATVGELSVLDVETGEFLARAPAELPRNFVFNDEPEDLFVGASGGQRRQLRIGGDRPSAFAYTSDLRFAWVGEGQETEIIELATGLPVAYPAYTDEGT